MAIYQNKNKDGKVISTKDGRSWYFRDYYFDIYGKKKQYKSPYYSSKKETQEAERKWLDKINNQHNLSSKNITFISAFEEWQDFKKTQIKASTHYGLVTRTDKHIKIFFKDYKLHFIKLDTINSWYKKLEKQTYSVEYKNDLISYLKDFLMYCIDNYDFDAKIVSKIHKFRNDSPKEKKTDAEINFWTCDEWKQFINIVDNYDYQVMLNFLYYTGLRFGEFAALNWKDFDIVNKTISVTKNLTTKIKEQKYIITTPKTKNSNRIVDLDDNLYNMLVEYKQYKKERSYKFKDSDFIFGNSVNYIAKTTFERHLKNYINKIENLKAITPHGFRHSHVSLLINLGCDNRDVAERIGDTVEIVEKTYYHMFPKKKKETVNVLNN